MGRLVDYCMMKIYALIRVKETNQTWSEEDDFVLEKPKLKLDIVGDARAGKMTKVQISCPNPLEVPLTLCKLTIDGSSFCPEIREKLQDIPPKSTVLQNVYIHPKKVGKATLVATFASEEMIDVYGSCKLEVRP